MGVITSGIIDFFVGIFQDIIKDKGKDIIESSIRNKRKWGLFSPKKKRYFNELENAIREMPFIYKDIELEVLTDFQDIKAIQVVTKGLEIKIHDKNAELTEKKIGQSFF